MKNRDAFKDAEAFQKHIEGYFGADFIEEVHAEAQNFSKMMSYYRCAMMEIETKFKVLNEHYSLEFDRNPIQTVKTRLKSPISIRKKLSRLGAQMTVSDIEHVLHDRADSLSGREKRIYSEAFENAYADHPEEFIKFIKSREVAVRGGYSKTWEYILRGTNSLKRGSNFGLFFDWNPKTPDQNST